MVHDNYDLFYSLEAVVIKKIKRKEALPILKEYHYLRGVGTSAMIYGLFEYGELKGVVSFQTPVSENVRGSLFGEEFKNNVTELSRLCLKPDVNSVASYFVSEAIKVFQHERSIRGMTPIYAILSFADTSKGHHGGVYQAMSWLFCGESKSKVTGFVDQEGVIRHRRQCGVNVTDEQAISYGWRVLGQGGGGL